MYPIKESFLAHVKFLFLQNVVFSSKLSQVRKIKYLTTYYIFYTYTLYLTVTCKGLSRTFPMITHRRSAINR